MLYEDDSDWWERVGFADSICLSSQDDLSDSVLQAGTSALFDAMESDMLREINLQLGIPSSADLDADAEEKRIKELTSGKTV